MVDPQANLRRRAADSGVTLVEILIVLVLIGVSAGVVSYALPSSPNARNVTQEVSLLRTRLDLAAERSLINATYYQLKWSDNSYGFEQWQDGEWRAAPVPPLSAPHKVASGMLLAGENGALRGNLVIRPDLLPDGPRLATLSLGDGALRRTVAFDGAAARILEVTP